MNKLKKTAHHLSVCSANFRRLKKILINYQIDKQSLLFDDSELTANFKVVDRQCHTLLVDASQFSNNKIMDFKFRLQIFLDAKLAEVISFQNEQPVPFFVVKPKSQSLDEKYQQNQMLTEWLEFILLKGRVETIILR
ncbi:MAG: DUF1249 domain-containing protein [Gammaproteobacteria bacterium]